MENEKATDGNVNWYDIWMKQSKIFFDSANKNFSEMLNQNANVNPEMYANIANQWIDNLRKQWDFSKYASEHSEDANYWKTMNKMYHDAADLLLSEWMKRFYEHNPVTNARELYEMWLRCCQVTHEKSLNSKSYQNAYGEFMNMAFKFWKNYIPQ